MGLYDEKVDFYKPVYDPATGREEALSYQEKEGLADTETAELGQAFENLKNSVGFQVLGEWLKERIELYKSKLIVETDLDKIRRYQEATKCYLSVFQKIDEHIANGQFVKQRKVGQS